MKRSELEKYLGRNVIVYFCKSAEHPTPARGILTKCSESWNKNYYFCKSITCLDYQLNFRCSYVQKVRRC